MDSQPQVPDELEIKEEPMDFEYQLIGESEVYPLVSDNIFEKENVLKTPRKSNRMLGPKCIRLKQNIAISEEEASDYEDNTSALFLRSCSVILNRIEILHDSCDESQSQTESVQSKSESPNESPQQKTFPNIRISSRKKVPILHDSCDESKSQTESVQSKSESPNKSPQQKTSPNIRISSRKKVPKKMPEESPLHGLPPRYSLETLENVVRLVKDNVLSVAESSRLYNIPVSTIRQRLYGRSRHSNIINIKPETKITPIQTQEPEQPCIKNTEEVKPKPLPPQQTPHLPKFVEIELVNHCKEVIKHGYPLNYKYLRDLVGQMVKSEKIKKLIRPFKNGKPSTSWASRFLNRHPEISPKYQTQENKSSNLSDSEYSDDDDDDDEIEAAKEIKIKKTKKTVKSKPKPRNKKKKTVKKVVAVVHHCNGCKAIFKSAKGLDDHNLKNHPNNRQFKCDQCSYAALTAGNLSMHMMNIHCNMTFYCYICGVKTCSRRNMYCHMLRKHFDKNRKKFKP